MEVSIESPASHARPFCDCQVGRVRRADRRVQLDCGVDDLLPSLVLALRTSLECVLPCDFRELPCDLIIDKPVAGRYRAISIQA